MAATFGRTKMISVAIAATSPVMAATSGRTKMIFAAIGAT
jgi:hypothetical protein